jgi:hypothetical protein
MSTLKAFNNLKRNLLTRINNIIKQSRTFDYDKSMKNIAWYHRLGYKLGCLKYNKKIQNKNSLKEIMDDINFELNANSARNPVN